MQRAGQNANSTKLSAKKILGNPKTQILLSVVFLLNIPADIDADGNGALNHSALPICAFRHTARGNDQCCKFYWLNIFCRVM